MSFITIAVQCHNFQKRLCWMLSSLVEQTNSDLILLDIAHVAGNGSPSTETIIDMFRQKLSIKSSVWSDYGSFKKRGLTRNRQLQECKTEWLLFSDCDMIYHPQYFVRLKEVIEENHPCASYLLSAGRYSTSVFPAINIVNTVQYPIPISNAFEAINALPKIRRSNVGAGFSQLVNVRHAPHEGFYVDPKKNRDWDWESRYTKAKSDMQFRRRIARRGGPRQSLPTWFTENLIHLNHYRDKEFGRHLEDQR
jgi:glycosyltransferase involved in cell wall biosynthesis